MMHSLSDQNLNRECVTGKPEAIHPVSITRGCVEVASQSSVRLVGIPDRGPGKTNDGRTEKWMVGGPVKMVRLESQVES
jgi:hypothetical protein